MRTNLVVLAVTKMRTGFCVAGIEPVTGRWIRPVKEFGSLRLGDISYADGRPMQPFDQASLELIAARGSPPHVEDWSCDFVRRRPTRIGEIAAADRLAALERWSSPDGSAVVARQERSLAMVGVRAFELTAEADAVTGHVDVRMFCPEAGLATPAPVTDLRVRALARSGGMPRSATHEWLQDRFGVRRWFVAVGLSRRFDGRIWPLVVALHGVPSIEAAVDYSLP
jgi:hypothetical protein